MAYTQLNMTELTTTDGNDEFYPTPDAMAESMLAGIDWLEIESVLEPSAGKGNLVRCALKAFIDGGYRHSDIKLNVDCIENDPYLRQIIGYEFGDKKRNDLNREIRLLEEKARRNREQEHRVGLTETDRTELDHLRGEAKLIEKGEINVIHDDFLTYHSVKKYGLILMNPPFSEGNKHLLKALEIQKNGGRIVCLLNAETIRNPYTNTRKLLARILNQYGAEVQYIKDGFANAERQADVEVAIVRVHIKEPERPRSEFYERMKRAAEAEEPDIKIGTDVTIHDIIQNMVDQFNVEVAASLAFIAEYKALSPHVLENYDTEAPYNNAIITISVDGKNYGKNYGVNEYLRRVRMKYWNALFSKKEFIGRLTSNLQEKYRGMVDKLADYDFSMFNIQTIVVEMNAEMIKGVKDTILDLFDKLSAEHSWYPECKNNVHYWNGWKTNKAHKVNNKVIIPSYGVFSDYSWEKKKFKVYEALKVLEDIEKAFNYLDGGLTEEVDLLQVLQVAERMDNTKNIRCKYFDVTLFKKGTTHIKFTNTALVDKLNIYAARNKAWLPPDYGYKPYKEMDQEARQTIDEFQGEEAYNTVVADKDYYLFEVKGDMPLMITQGGVSDVCSSR